jgi:1-acyl-sn-glycerol-3-phosphate acyltransferase
MWVLLALGGFGIALLVRWQMSGQGLVDFLGLGLVNSYARLWHRWSCNRPAGLPTSGPALIVSNHTCSSDPSFVVAGCKRRVGFLIAREFFANEALRRFFDWIRSVPVVRDGRDVKAVRLALKNLADGHVLCIFPEGGLSNAGRGKMRPGKLGVALIALRSRVAVYPVAVSGGPQCDSILQAWLLPSAPTRVRVTYGDPVDLSAYYDRPITRKLLDEVTRLIMGKIAELEKQAPPEIARRRLSGPISRARRLRLAHRNGRHHHGHHRSRSHPPALQAVRGGSSARSA